MLQKDYRGTQRSRTSKSYGLGEFALFKKKEGTIGHFIPDDLKRHVITVIIGKSFGFDVEGLQQVLADTSEGKAPLLPFYFLFDAERALRGKLP